MTWARSSAPWTSSFAPYGPLGQVPQPCGPRGQGPMPCGWYGQAPLPLEQAHLSWSGGRGNVHMKVNTNVKSVEWIYKNEIKNNRHDFPLFSWLQSLHFKFCVTFAITHNGKYAKRWQIKYTFLLYFNGQVTVTGTLFCRTQCHWMGHLVAQWLIVFTHLIFPLHVGGIHQNGEIQVVTWCLTEIVNSIHHCTLL